jgi:hypothetical protein
MTKERYNRNNKEYYFLCINRSVSTNKMNDCVQVNLRITTNSNQGNQIYFIRIFIIFFV